jgi:hypothetical protein
MAASRRGGGLDTEIDVGTLLRRIPNLSLPHTKIRYAVSVMGSLMGIPALNGTGLIPCHSALAPHFPHLLATERDSVIQQAVEIRRIYDGL